MLPSLGPPGATTEHSPRTHPPPDTLTDETQTICLPGMPPRARANLPAAVTTDNPSYDISIEADWGTQADHLQTLIAFCLLAATLIACRTAASVAHPFAAAATNNFQPNPHRPTERDLTPQ